MGGEEDSVQCVEFSEQRSGDQKRKSGEFIDIGERLKVTNFKDLIVWQKSHQLTLEIYKITSHFPPDERFGIVNQMRRAAYSIPSNIAEGYSRKSRKEYLQFLNFAKGSLQELKYFIILSHDLNYISYDDKIKLDNSTEEISKILYKFTKNLTKE